LDIFKKDKEKKEKVIEYVNFFNSLEVDLNYIEEIVKDEHSIDFFYKGYNSAFQKLDNLFRLYNNKLTADQSTQIVNLMMNVSKLMDTMNMFGMFNISIKESNVQIEVGHLQDFKGNVTKTINTIDKLMETI